MRAHVAAVTAGMASGHIVAFIMAPVAMTRHAKRIHRHVVGHPHRHDHQRPIGRRVHDVEHMHGG
jgi:hypothetical protein